MNLQVGDKLGPYEILAPIGVGGMGAVYKARDTRLDRLVAIKTSKTEFSERFAREARAVAALNHPNICQLYDLGTLPEGGSYLVMEYIDGAPLAAVDSPRKLLELAVQLADGMAAAHTAGFTHRDLKPDNILVTGPQTPNPGRVKILDFGLAKYGPLLEQSEATQTLHVTNPGTVMGTVAYMSPEQARGEEVDARSDQFSFGLILYELAARKRAFVRPSTAETMAAIIREEAEPLSNTPAPLRWVVERCLAKDPAERYDSTKDLYRELKLARERLSEASASQSASVPASVEVAKKKRSLGWGPAWLAAGLALAGLGFWAFAPGKAELTHTPMEVTWANPGPGYWAPDGKAFAYSAEVNGAKQVFVRYLDTAVPMQLTRFATSAEALGWSSDSRQVMFVSRNTKGPTPRNALFTVRVTGGEPEWVQGVGSIANALSPNGRMFAELRREQVGGYCLYLTTPLGGAAQKYQPWPIELLDFSVGYHLRFAPDGKSVWFWFDQSTGRQLWRFPVPAGSGPPQRMLEKEMPKYGPTPSMSFLGGARHAVVALQDGLEEDATHLRMVDLQSGKRDRLTEGASMESSPSVSPDGTRLLYLSTTSEHRIVSMSVADGSVETVISSGRIVGMPAWAAGQEKFAYVSHRNGGPTVWVRENGADRPLVTASAFPGNPVRFFSAPVLSPDGGRVVYVREGLDGRLENWISNLSGGPPVRLTSNGPDVTEHGGSWSPDGSRFVFLQLQNGKSMVAVAKTNGESAVTILRKGCSSPPEWSPDGKWIKYLRPPAPTGWVLISPDGKEDRVLGERGHMTFSKDSKQLYGIRKTGGRPLLFSLDIATTAEREIREIDQENLPWSPLRTFLQIRLSLSPDGKRILYPTYKTQTSLWMLEGFRRPGWLP